MSDFDFDFKDYAVRQFRIWALILGAWATFVILGMISQYAGIEDSNTVQVLVFAALMTFIVLVMGLYVSFVAWTEKKLFQYKKKIDDAS